MPCIKCSAFNFPRLLDLQCVKVIWRKTISNAPSRPPWHQRRQRTQVSLDWRGHGCKESPPFSSSPISPFPWSTLWSQRSPAWYDMSFIRLWRLDHSNGSLLFHRLANFATVGITAAVMVAGPKKNIDYSIVLKHGPLIWTVKIVSADLTMVMTDGSPYAIFERWRDVRD